MSKLTHVKDNGEIIEKDGVHVCKECGKRFKGEIYGYWLRGDVLIPFPDGACDMKLKMEASL